MTLPGNSHDGEAEILRIFLGATPAAILHRFLAYAATDRRQAGSTEYQYRGTVAPARAPVHNPIIARDRLRDSR